MTHDDEPFLRRALELARANVAAGGGPFGAVVVQDGRIVSEARNEVVARCDPTAHAEVEALRAAGQALGAFHFPRATLYASSEPCPMCLAAAYWARIGRIVYANPRHIAAAAGFCDDEFYTELMRSHENRRIRLEHLALPDAEAPFLAWRDKADKTPY